MEKWVVVEKPVMMSERSENTNEFNVSIKHPEKKGNHFKHTTGNLHNYC